MAKKSAKHALATWRQGRRWSSDITYTKTDATDGLLWGVAFDRRCASDQIITDSRWLTVSTPVPSRLIRRTGTTNKLRAVPSSCRCKQPTGAIYSFQRSFPFSLCASVHFFRRHLVEDDEPSVSVGIATSTTAVLKLNLVHPSISLRKRLTFS